MRVLPASIRGRLLVIAVATTLAALVVAGLGIAGLLERYVTGTVDTRLDDRLAVFSAAVTRAGAIDPALANRLDTIAARDGMWRIDAPHGTAGSTMTDGDPGISFAGGQQLGPVATLAAGRHHPDRRDPDRDGRPARGPSGLEYPPGDDARSRRGPGSGGFGPPDEAERPSPPSPARLPPLAGRTVDGGPGRDDPPAAPPPPPVADAGLAPTPFDARLADGTRVHGRWQRVPTDAGPALVAVAVPRWMIDQPVRQALTPLVVMLALVGALLAVATIVQLRVGLRPLDRLRLMLAEVRGGTRRRINLDVATELRPVVVELNALIDAQHAQLERARGHVANLAHGLKTPLAALRLDLPAHDPAGILTAQVDRIEGQVRHHLGRARAASIGDLATPPVALAPVVADLTDALSRIHADRGIACTPAVPPSLTVRCDRQDLEELLGNLLDNAWRHARTRVDLTATVTGRDATIAIADDGPGIPADRLADAVRPGRRLDEAGDGHGFGIPIARELVELHGGSLAMAGGEGGGLTVTIRLPAGVGE
ncbi:sensor histidine kinase [Sphingomonas sp. 1P08PE]|uniref:sensor histidine kinase n=1 Tax=Sphingomonas sp. 1P08PE TaxID=554122 RepID=UPI00399EFC15